MPADFKRVPCPQETFVPQLYCKTEADKTCLLNENNRRKDDRALEDIRPIFLRVGTISQARGSAYIEACNTKVICAVYGPHEAQRREGFSMQGTLRCEFKYATFSCPARRQHQPDSEDRRMALIIEQALQPAVCLHKFPKSQLDVFVTVLQNDGSVLSAALTCASVAVANAGIEMYDVVIGCSLRQFGDTTSLLDPTLTEEDDSLTLEGPGADNHGSITVGFLPSLDQLSAILQTGELEANVVTQCLKNCMDGCLRIFPVVNQCLVKAVRRKPPPHQDKNPPPKEGGA